MGADRLESGVTLVYPKVRKKEIQGLVRARFPSLYESITVLLMKRKDRRYRKQQSGVFDRLPGIADKPFHIEIETLNKCNSTCAFCPVNRHVDPRILQRMDESLFQRIIDELADWNYDRVVNLFSNNEPFLDTRIFEFTEYARAKLPQGFLQIISNGTALDVKKVERILPLLSRLIINNYGTSLELHDNVRAIVNHLNTNRPDLAQKLVVGLRQLDEFKTTRAGNAPNRAVQTVTYQSRCAYPFFQMVIRPSGKVSLCCNDALGQVTLGDISRNSIRDAWHSKARQEAQKAMLKGRDQIPLCAKCDSLGWAKPKRIAAAIETGNFSGAFTTSPKRVSPESA